MSHLYPFFLSVILLAIAIGLLQCFLGYRVIHLILGLFGFLGGALAGMALAATATSEFAIVIFGGLLGGVGGAVLMVLLFYVGIFLLGMSAGSLIAFSIASEIAMQVHPAAVLLPGLATGILALIYQRPMIILITSYGGAAHVVNGILMLALGMGVGQVARMTDYATPRGAAAWIALATWIALGTAGMVFQFKTNPHPTGETTR